MNWKSATTCHKGHVRLVNQDAVLNCPEKGLWGVADGIAGGAHGEIASETVCERLKLLDLPNFFDDAVEAVCDSLLATDVELNQLCGVLGSALVGTTATVLLISGDSGAALWVGDSRLYRIRRRAMTAISSDHVARDKDGSPRGISRAIGSGTLNAIDRRLFDVEPDDIFLLCTDGVYRELDDALMEEVVGQYTQAASITSVIEELLLAGPARDNFALACVSKI